MKLIARMFLAWLLLAPLFTGKAGAVEPMARMPAEQNVAAAAIEKVATGVFRIGDIVINKNDRSITFPAQVNMDRGMLEYLIVHRKGKTHESLLNTLVEPYDLQIAFLLLGFEGSDKKLAMQGDPSIPQGDAIGILIRQKDGAQAEAIAAERWLINKFDDATRDVETMKWVYTGSVTFQGRFMSQESGSVVAIWHDPVALIDNASPGGESNRIWFVKEGTVPPVGTPVEVILVSVK